ncbi:MAG: hypothetical protein ABEH56_00845 [Salinirussus sp.]
MNDRGRVPFALIGVLLLVSSATFASSLGGPVPTDPDVDDAMGGMVAATQTAVRSGVSTAARNAARNPVTAPANTSVGGVIAGERPFDAALRLRIYTRVRENLEAISGTERGLRIRAGVPTPVEATEIRRAIDRVRIGPAGPNGTWLAARVENVSITATRGGRVVGRRAVSPRVVVRSPVLAVHDRVRRFERRLDSGPLSPGLGRRVTAQLYPVAWARGYAQYGGAPIANVLGNRHVSLATNGAVLDMQEAAFGESDPVGRDALGLATREVAVTDLLAGIDHPITTHLQRARNGTGADSPVVRAREDIDHTAATRPREELTVRIGKAADEAFVETLSGLNRTLRRTYTARVRRRVAAERTGGKWLQRESPPDGDWELLEKETESQVSVEGGGSEVDGPSSDDGWHVLATYSRSATRHRTVRRVWRRGTRTETTRSERTDRFDVRVFLEGRHQGGPAPDRPIALVHQPGGALDGPNLAGIEDRARERLVDGGESVDGVVREHLSGDREPVVWSIVGERPTGLDEWVSRGLIGLHRTVRNRSVTTTGGSVATFEANPAGALRRRLERQRARLVDAPEQYRSVAHRARLAARASYLDAVVDRLGDRAAGHERRETAVDDLLPGNVTTAGVQAAYRKRAARQEPPEPAGLRMRVDGVPSYLVRTNVSREQVPGVPRGSPAAPLAVKNTNVVSPPYGEVRSTVVDAFFQGGTRLRTAATVLGAGDTGRGRSSETRERLEAAVDEANHRVRERLVAELAGADIGNATGRREVVAAGLSGWSGTAERALAVTNGSVAAAVVGAVSRRWPGLDRSDRYVLRLRLAAALRDQREAGPSRIDRGLVGGVVESLRAEARRRVTGRTDRAAARATNGTLSRLPAGLPVAPVPGFWYATVNLWRVRVRGEYARFVVRVPRGTADRPGGGFAYVRQQAPVRLDVDDDGTSERMGRTEPVSFGTGTTIAVAVPPGPQGVGDVGGQRSERSPGWPEPGWNRTALDG